MKLGCKLIIIQAVLLVLVAATFIISFSCFVIPHNVNRVYTKAKQITAFMQETFKFMTIEQQQRAIEKIISASDDLSYILVVDHDGKAVVHSEPSRIGKIFNDSGTLSAAKYKKFVQQEYWRDKDNPESPYYRERCLDILFPLYNVEGVYTGAVNIGLSLNAVDKETTQYYIMMLVSLLFIVTFIALILVFNHLYIVKPIIQISSFADKLSKGETNFNIPKYNKDEIGDLFRVFLLMKQNIEGIIQEINKLSNSAIDGKLDYRIPDNKYLGKYKEMLKGVNNTVESIVQPLNLAAEYIDRISKGDIPVKINNNFKGDFNNIKNNLNQCIDAINLLLTDSKVLFSSAIEGHINYRADIMKHNGEFGKIISGVNATLDRLVGLIDEMPVYVQIVDENNDVIYHNNYIK
jgi:HAMP domain-containing protein